MNRKTWDAYYLALNIKKDFPKGISDSELDNRIMATFGWDDKRTLPKYKLLITECLKYFVKKNDDLWHVVNNIEAMKPMSERKKYELNKEREQNES